MPASLEYTLAFIFNLERTRVALIRKTHPDWQAKRLNGIGGAVGNSEVPFKAALREVEEECGLSPRLYHFATYYGRKPSLYTMYLYWATVPNLHEARTLTDEEVEVWTVDHVLTIQGALVRGVHGLLPIAQQAACNEDHI